MMIELQLEVKLTFGGDFGYSVFDPKFDHLDDKISYRNGGRRSFFELFRRFAPATTTVSGEGFLDDFGRFRAPFPPILEGEMSGGGFPCSWRNLEAFDGVKSSGARTLAPAIFSGDLSDELPTNSSGEISSGRNSTILAEKDGMMIPNTSPAKS